MHMRLFSAVRFLYAQISGALPLACAVLMLQCCVGQDLAPIIAKAWLQLTPDERAGYESRAAQELQQYAVSGARIARVRRKLIAHCMLLIRAVPRARIIS